MLGRALAAAIAAPVGAAFAQRSWPARPVRALVGYPPGGGIDLMARSLVPALGNHWGQTIIVDNKPGALGNIATSEVVRAPADGYTALITTTLQQSVNPLVVRNSPNMARDLVPVAVVGRFTYALLARPDLPVRTVAELVTLAKAQPGKISFASIGPGSLPHLLGELFQQQSGTRLLHVPYKGAAPAIQAMLASEVDLSFTASAGTFVDSGKLRMLAVVSENRSARYPQVPTLSESGVAVADGSSWVGVWLPRATPEEIVDIVDKGLAFAVAQPDVRKRIEDLGAEPIYLPPSKFRELLEREEKVMAGIVRARNIVIE